MRLAEWGDRIRHSLWFVPTICTTAAAVAALLLVWLSALTDLEATELPLLFGAGADGARAMLQAIAGSIITVAGVVFSITIIALQLASTQFSPRVLRSFLRDRANQLVLGVFMGTFTYAILVLRSIRGVSEDQAEFVPALAISGAVALTLVSLGMLIYFIHHISVRIQVTSIVASVAEETAEAIEHLAGRWKDDSERSWHPAAAAAPAASPPSGAVPRDAVPAPQHLLPAPESGYLQFVDVGHLVGATREVDGRLRLFVGPGAWVQRGLPVAAIEQPDGGTPDDEHMARMLSEGLGTGHERTVSEDAAFGVQQLVDVAIKALSPSINDPTSAMNCVDRLVQVLAVAGTNPDPPRAFADDDGTVRLEVPFPGFDEMVDLAFDQIRHYGASTPAVVIHLARALSMLRSLPPNRQPTLTRHAKLLADAAAASITLVDERERAMEAIRPLLR